MGYDTVTLTGIHLLAPGDTAEVFMTYDDGDVASIDNSNQFHGFLLHEI